VGSVLKLMKPRVNDNTEAYLTIFERMVMVYGVERNWWSYILASQLTRKLQGVMKGGSGCGWSSDLDRGNST